MIFDAMQANEAEGVAMVDAHPDLEGKFSISVTAAQLMTCFVIISVVFRLRLGKALDYEYNEDSQTGLFQRRDPREGAFPSTDILRRLIL